MNYSHPNHPLSINQKPYDIQGVRMTPGMDYIRSVFELKSGVTFLVYGSFSPNSPIAFKTDPQLPIPIKETVANGINYYSFKQRGGRITIEMFCPSERGNGYAMLFTCVH